MFAPYLRVFKFTGEVFGMIKDNPRLLAPSAMNLALATVASIVLAVVYAFASEYQALGFLVLAVGVSGLYFIDYLMGAMTVSLVYDQVTTGEASLGQAASRTFRASPGILVFAAISGALDLLASYARERRDILASILLMVVRAVWTTAVYVLMPAMVIEGTGFFGAFKRSKQLMKEDPTQVGVGVVGIGIVTYLLGAVVFTLAFGALQAVPIPLVGVLIFFMLVNVYWTVSGFLKSVYYTCFYLWARECEQRGAADPSFAPRPLANALSDLSMQPAAVGY
ncbi:MAG TPA: DUF6159 family protein [Sandaracinaceae bacterium LLY-WYZ-13_1]|nr:DUF6159 family protein [Sandaracinaceae bacterium LLY-WYZ-13_1]